MGAPAVADLLDKLFNFMQEYYVHSTHLRKLILEATLL